MTPDERCDDMIERLMAVSGDLTSIVHRVEWLEYEVLAKQKANEFRDEVSKDTRLRDADGGLAYRAAHPSVVVDDEGRPERTRAFARTVPGYEEPLKVDPTPAVHIKSYDAKIEFPTVDDRANSGPQGRPYADNQSLEPLPIFIKKSELLEWLDSMERSHRERPQAWSAERVTEALRMKFDL